MIVKARFTIYYMPLSYATRQNASCRVGFAASLDFESILATRQRTSWAAYCEPTVPLQEANQPILMISRLNQSLLNCITNALSRASISSERWSTFRVPSSMKESSERIAWQCMVIVFRLLLGISGYAFCRKRARRFLGISNWKARAFCRKRSHRKRNGSCAFWQVTTYILPCHSIFCRQTTILSRATIFLDRKLCRQRCIILGRSAVAKIVG